MNKTGPAFLSLHGALPVCRMLLGLALLLTAAASKADESSFPTNSPAAETTPEGIGLQAGSALTSMLYLPLKTVLALSGGLVGGIAYAVTGADLEVAQAVWEPTLYGTYVITPEHLAGQKPVQFIGSAPPVERAAQPY